MQAVGEPPVQPPVRRQGGIVRLTHEAFFAAEMRMCVVLEKGQQILDHRSRFVPVHRFKQAVHSLQHFAMLDVLPFEARRKLIAPFDGHGRPFALFHRNARHRLSRDARLVFVGENERLTLINDLYGSLIGEYPNRHVASFTGVYRNLDRLLVNVMEWRNALR